MKISIYRLAFLILIIGGIATALMAGSPFMTSTETCTTTTISGAGSRLPTTNAMCVDSHKDTIVSVAINNKTDDIVRIIVKPQAWGRQPSRSLPLDVIPTLTNNAERHEVRAGAINKNSSAIVYSVMWDFYFETLSSYGDYNYDAYVYTLHLQ